jgi:hypothetical protein
MITFYEVLNLDTRKIEKFELIPNTPHKRKNHKIYKTGSILILYGGEDQYGNKLNDVWKFIIKSRDWIRINMNIDDNKFFLRKSHFIFTKSKFSERPVIFGGLNKNNDPNNDIIIFDLDICLTEKTIISDYICIPCAEGFILNNQKCEHCQEGTFHNVNTEFYINSKCELCPPISHNQNIKEIGKNSCELCSSGFYNEEYGQKTCKECKSDDEYCATGTFHPIDINTYLIPSEDPSSIYEYNNPDIFGKNKDLKSMWMTYAIFIVLGLTFFALVILFIMYKIKPKQVARCLIRLDFIPKNIYFISFLSA